MAEGPQGAASPRKRSSPSNARRCARERRELPWERVEKAYVFEGPEGRLTLADLFGGKSQLIVYHFMFGPDWTRAARAARSGPTTTTASTSIWRIATPRWSPSRARRSPSSRPTRSAWAGRSAGCRRPAATSTSTIASRSARRSASTAQTTITARPSRTARKSPGLSAFRRGDDGAIYHTYSTYSRGLDVFNGAYQMLDLTSKGRDEAGLPWSMAWVKRHDRY